MAVTLLVTPASAQDPGEAESVHAALGAGTWIYGSQDEHAGHAGHLHTFGYAPIGVMGDHLLETGEWMVSYRFMRMDMNGPRDGTKGVSMDSVVSPTGFNYMIAPTRMNMDMHMFGGMFGVSDNFTVMAMLPYVVSDMDHVTSSGVEFTTESEGLGDLKLTGLYKLWTSGMQQLHLNSGISLPTGSINARDRTPASPTTPVKLPYPMQLGSGTFDLMPGMTYVGIHDGWQWGAQFVQTLRLDENSNQYRLGNRSDLTGWFARELVDGLDVSLRLSASRWGNIHGEDPDLVGPAAVVPTADPDLRGGRRIDLFGGLSYQRGGHRFALEVGTPVFEDLDGPQLETDLIWTLGWQYAR